MTVHPGAALFKQRIRRRVADGPVFDQRRNDIFVRAADGLCVVSALAQDGPLNQAFTDAEREAFRDLIARNDRGHYADRRNLRRDLLGADDDPDAEPSDAVQRAAFERENAGRV